MCQAFEVRCFVLQGGQIRTLCKEADLWLWLTAIQTTTCGLVKPLFRLYIFRKNALKKLNISNNDIWIKVVFEKLLTLHCAALHLSDALVLSQYTLG